MLEGGFTLICKTLFLLIKIKVLKKVNLCCLYPKEYYICQIINLKTNKMVSTKTFKIEVEIEQYDVLNERKKETGITLDFQLREAIKMYVELIQSKK